MHFIDLTVTKNSVATAIMLAITQLYSLCMYYFQELNFNQAEQEGEGARSAWGKFAEQMTEGLCTRVLMGQPPAQIMWSN